MGGEVIADRRAAQVRGTQTLVDQMGWMLRHPAIVAIEVGWRWLFGVPFLLVCWSRLQHVFTQLSPEDAGLGNIDVQNPWIAAGQLSRALARYEPLLAHEMRWLRTDRRLCMDCDLESGTQPCAQTDGTSSAPAALAMMVLQAAWLALFGGVCWGWFRAVGWAAATHFPAGSEPDLIGFSIWLIFLSLAFFTVWALLGWIVSVAPVLMLLERRSAVSALGMTTRLGKAFTSELLRSAW